MEKFKTITIKKSNLLMVHNKDYIDTIFTTARHNKPLGVPGPSINLSMRNIGSLESILAAVASCMGGVDTVCGKFKVSDKNNRYANKRMRKVFCNVRPPGNHAGYDRGNKFCFLNNVAIGTKFAMDKYKNFIKKVLIF